MLPAKGSSDTRAGSIAVGKRIGRRRYAARLFVFRRNGIVRCGSENDVVGYASIDFTAPGWVESAIAQLENPGARWWFDAGA